MTQKKTIPENLFVNTRPVYRERKILDHVNLEVKPDLIKEIRLAYFDQLNLIEGFIQRGQPEEIPHQAFLFITMAEELFGDLLMFHEEPAACYFQQRLHDVRGRLLETAEKDPSKQ